MQIQPHDLVGFGERYVFAEHEPRAGQTATLTAMPGPPLDLASGRLALADPWWPEGAPTEPVTDLGAGSHPTTLSTVGLLRAGHAEPVTVACAASIGELDRVAAWRPVAPGFRVEVDSGLGAFYDITDASALLPSFQDDQRMREVFDRTLADNVVTLRAGDRATAVVFECPDGPGLYPVYVGTDPHGRAVAVLMDLLVLSGAVDCV